jgi:hypothetical protein
VATPTGTSGNSYAEETTGCNSYGLPEGEAIKVTAGTFAGTLADHRRSTGSEHLPQEDVTVAAARPRLRTV